MYHNNELRMGISSLLYKIGNRLNAYRNRVYLYCNLEKISNANISPFLLPSSFSDKLSSVLGCIPRTLLLGYAGRESELINNLANHTLSNYFKK